MTGERKWQRFERFAEDLGSFGSPDRAAIDRFTITKWVQGLAPWDVFGTFTFAREGVSVAGASRAFEKFCKRWIRGAPVVYFIEQNPTRGDGGHHIHALFFLEGGSRRRLWELWFKQYGVCRIEPIVSSEGVSQYCSKLAPYVTKSMEKGGLWWNVVGCRRCWQDVAEQKRSV